MGAGSSADSKPGALKKAPTVPGFKIVIVGDSEVGKTSIYLRFLHNQFCPLYVPTTKVSIDNVVQKMNQPSHALVSLTLWDVPGREDLSLHSSYFRDMDALIVVVDLTDDTSIRMAPVWKQLALNNFWGHKKSQADHNGDDDDNKLPTTRQPPVLLLGNKLDVIEEQLLAELQAAEKTEADTGDSGTTLPLRKQKQKLQKPACIQLLESVSEKAYFTGSAVVSAKSGDGSVSEAIKAFVRHLLEKGDMPRRFRPRIIEERQKKSRDCKTYILDRVGIPQFDDLFSQGQVLVTRVASLDAHFKDTLRHFQHRCHLARVVGGGGGGVPIEDNSDEDNDDDEDDDDDDRDFSSFRNNDSNNNNNFSKNNSNDGSLQSCLVGLRDRLKQQDPPITMKLVLKDQFCVLEAKAALDVELPTNIRYALKTFNKEFAAVCQAAASELPTVISSLDTLDARLASLCSTYKPPPPPPPGTKPSTPHSQQQPGDSGDGSGVVIDLQATDHKVERNRAYLRHAKHQAEDILKNVASALKKARTAVVW